MALWGSKSLTWARVFLSGLTFLHNQWLVVLPECLWYLNHH
ncbi:hypothetical protein NC652_014069 [Populus alba x Populus x berolinensis]|nr:hypothetical protein NC652_014069 [Populus alba x Populus x berolinensis]